MDFPAAVKDDALRPVATIVAPGAVALGPYLVALQYYVPAVTRFWSDHETAFSFIVALGVLLVGFLLEEFGAIIENWWDRLIISNDKDHLVIWNVYLQLDIKDGVVGEHYLRDKLTRFKFELSMAPALILCAGGLAWINAIYQSVSLAAIAGIAVGLVALGLFLLWESFKSAELLGATRRLIVNANRLNETTEMFGLPAPEPKRRAAMYLSID